MLIDREKLTLQIKGLNFSKFLSELKKEDIKTTNFIKLEYNLFEITIFYKDRKKFLAICKKMNYRVKNKNFSFLLSIFIKSKQNIALVLSIIFISFCLVFSSNFVFKIEILGIEKLNKQQIISVLEKNNIKPYKVKNTYNTSNIELILKTNINKISFASAIIKGNTLIINIDEKIDNDEYIYDYKPKTAPYNCIIENIVLKSGTVVVEKGQTVKQGEEVVLPYIKYKDGSLLKVEANADITAYIEVSKTTAYKEFHTEYIRTGNKQVFTNTTLFGLGKKKNYNVKYDKYEVETFFNMPFKNFILPIKRTSQVYYELKPKTVFTSFEKVKQNIIEENKKVLYNNLSNKIKKEVEVYSTITCEDDIYFVTTYLKALITF